MNLIEKTKLIQRKVGAAEDGVWGNESADKVLDTMGLSGEAIDTQPLVRGNGKNIKRIFIHTTATREGQHIDAATVKRWHTTPKSKGGRGWSDIGYQFLIQIDGTIEKGRDEAVPGAHVAGFNTGSIGVVYVGGLDAQGRAKDTRTEAQKEAMAWLLRELTKAYPGSDVLGHRDASPDLDGDGVIEPHEWLKDCPCFEVRAWWESVK